MSQNYENVKELMDKSQSIVITTHAGPDADGIGSQVALCMALNQMGKDSICVNEEPLLERYNYLDPENSIMAHAKFSADKSIDLFIVVDTNNTNRIGPKMQQLAQKAKNILFIDHHPCPKEVANLHCIDTTAAATGQVVGEIIEYLGIEFTKKMALPLYTAILIDTSSFRYPTVTGRTHLLISKLLSTGVKPPNAYNMIYGAKKIAHMQLLGKVLSSARTNSTEEVSWICVTEDMIDNFDSDIEDTHAFINHLLVLDNIKVACMFRNEGKHVKVSFRSAGDIDVGVIAQALGGGGHNHSAATLIEGDIDEVVTQTISKIEKILSAA